MIHCMRTMAALSFPAPDLNLIILWRSICQMQITFLGQAGLFIETKGKSILCDPWFNPAYFASWFPFPSNEGIDPRRIGNPTYLYISHLHHDHYDPTFLARQVSKDATVILPDYP